VRIALGRPEQVDAVRAAAHDQEVGVDAAGVDQVPTREQVADRERRVDARHGVEVEHRRGGRLDVRDQVRRVRLARLGQVDLVADPGRGALARVVRLRIERRADEVGGRRQPVFRRPPPRAVLGRDVVLL